MAAVCAGAAKKLKNLERNEDWDLVMKQLGERLESIWQEWRI
jgi:hypothetical protein